jgi:hypothetical protein
VPEYEVLWLRPFHRYLPVRATHVSRPSLMAKKTPPDERLVYLALKNIFKGADAQLRRQKKIREVIERHRQRPDVRALLEEHNIESICNAAKILLDNQIYESTLKAKIRFPEVFEVSPAQSAEREASEAEAAKSEADAIKDAAEGRQGEHEINGEVEIDLPSARKGKAKGSVSGSPTVTVLVDLRLSFLGSD